MLLRKAEVNSVKSFETYFMLELKVSEPFEPDPGQFAMVEVPGRTLMRPLSIFEVEGPYVRFLVKEKGKGTKELKHLRSGVNLKVICPLGKGFPLPEVGDKPLLLAGGVGIAGLFHLAKELHRHFFRVQLLWGGKGASSFPFVILSRLLKIGVDVTLCSEDGSIGLKGLLTDFLPPLDKRNVLYACGPKEMLERLIMHIPPTVRLYLGLEERMACGVGACLSCALKTPSGVKRVCADGPVFERGELL